MFPEYYGSMMLPQHGNRRSYSSNEIQALMRACAAASTVPMPSPLPSLIEAESRSQVAVGTVQTYVDRFVLKTDELLEENAKLRAERDEALNGLYLAKNREREGDPTTAIHYLQDALKIIALNERPFGRNARKEALDEAQSQLNRIAAAVKIHP